MTSTLATHPDRARPPARRHRLRRPLVTTALMLALVEAGGGAAPAVAAPAAFSTVESCTSVTATVSYRPGLTGTARNQTMTLTGTLNGCSNFANGPSAGTGTINGVLTGSSRVGAVTGHGTVTINWPVSSGFNPTTGTVTFTGPDTANGFALNGTTTGGAFTGGVLNVAFSVTSTTGSGTNRRPVTRQGLTNTTPLTVKRNFG